MKVASIILVVVLGAFALFEVVSLIGTIRKRKASKRNKAEQGEERKSEK